MRTYEVRFIDSFGHRSSAISAGNNGIEAAENAIENGLLRISPSAAVDAVAINVANGIAIKFEMAVAS